MGLLGRLLGHKQAADEGDRPVFGSDTEDPVVRHYRYLLRTAPREALVAAHAEALARLDPFVRATALGTVRRQMARGQRLTPDDIAPLAELLTRGEQDDPGALIGAFDPAILHRLGQQVVRAEAVAALWERYDDWDGAEPSPPEQAPRPPTPWPEADPLTQTG